MFFSGSDFYQQGFLFGSSNVFSCVVCSVYVAFPNWTRQGVEVRVEVRPSALFKPPQTKTPSARISPRPSTLFASFTTFGQNFPWPQPPLCPRRFLRHLRPEFPLAPAPSSLPSPPSAEIFLARFTCCCAASRSLPRRSSRSGTAVSLGSQQSRYVQRCTVTKPRSCRSVRCRTFTTHAQTPRVNVAYRPALRMIRAVHAPSGRS